MGKSSNYIESCVIALDVLFSLEPPSLSESLIYELDSIDEYSDKILAGAKNPVIIDYVDRIIYFATCYNYLIRNAISEQDALIRDLLAPLRGLSDAPLPYEQCTVILDVNLDGGSQWCPPLTLPVCASSLVAP